MTALDWHLHRFLGICADWCLSGLNLIATKTKKKAMQKLKNKKKKLLGYPEKWSEYTIRQ